MLSESVVAFENPAPEGLRRAERFTYARFEGLHEQFARLLEVRTFRQFGMILPSLKKSTLPAVLAVTRIVVTAR
jgi:hypothetical protein